MADNKQYKDATFRHLFNTKKNILELYKAVSGDCSLTEQDIELCTLDYSFDNGCRNDLAFTCDNRLIVLMEHQSTVNENIALRMFLYLAQYLDQKYSGKELYRKKRIKLPEPKFYVFYIGKDKMPEQWVERLSYSFESKSQEWLDLKVECYNINKSAEGKVLQRSQLLMGYSILIEKVKRYIAEGMKPKQAIAKAVQECIAEGILVEFLTANKEEVEGMFTMQWNFEDALRMRREEGLEEGIGIGEAKGREEGEAKGKLEEKNNFAKMMLRARESVSKIMEYTQLPLERIQELAKTMGVAVVM